MRHTAQQSIRKAGWQRTRKVCVGAVLAMTLLAVPAVADARGVPAADTRARVIGSAAKAGACVPELVVLPATSDTAWASVREMSDAGLVVGTVFDEATDTPTHVVVWRGNEPPVETGIGGTSRPNGSRTFGYPQDVNEHGIVLATRYRETARGRSRGPDAFTWDNTTETRTQLPATRTRPRAEALALNDDGVAVGYVRGRGQPLIPVYWRDGKLEWLRLPKGAERGYAVDINNHGLIVGHVTLDGETVPWWWRRVGGNGPLRYGNLNAPPAVVAVNDRGRIVGDRSRSFDRNATYLWRDRTARARRILGRDGGVTAMTDSRLLTGADGGFRGFSDRAWVARMGDSHVTDLPDPPEQDDMGWDNTFGWAIARGVTPFAPNGGITVGGSASPGGDDVAAPALLWTCAQTYLR